MLEIPTMTVTELDSLLQNNDVILIDVREQWEYEEANIAQSIHVPLSDISMNHLESLLESSNNDKNCRPVVMQCRSGKRSLKACQLLKEQDCPWTLYNLEGGIIAWSEEKLPLEVISEQQ